MIRIGILGCANIAIRSIMPSLRLHPDFQIAGVASRSSEKASRVAVQYQCKSYSYEELINDPNIQAIYIPLPNAMHYQWIKLALQKQKHVLCEKSLGVSVAEVIELSEIANQNEKILMENFQFRFHSQFIELKRLIEANTIGGIRLLRATFSFPPFSDRAQNIRYSARLGGGALLDAGAYTTKISSLLIGDELQVVGASLRCDKACDVDIGGSALLVSPAGYQAQIAFGFDSFYQCTVEILGEFGKISTSRIFTAPKDLNPLLKMENQQGSQNIVLGADDHFYNMLTYFSRLILTNDYRKETNGNIIQARLLEDIRHKALQSSLNN